MKKHIRWLTLSVACVVVASLIMLYWLNSSREHPLVKDIGLPIVEDRSESNFNVSRRALVFSKAHEDHGLYELICERIKTMYSGDDFSMGVELKKIPRPILIDDQYTKNPARAFQIDSRDFRSVIWVTEYDNYVVVFLADSRI